jgi:hypothetical protein
LTEVPRVQSTRSGSHARSKSLYYCGSGQDYGDSHLALRKGLWGLGSYSLVYNPSQTIPKKENKTNKQKTQTKYTCLKISHLKQSRRKLQGTKS